MAVTGLCDRPGVIGALDAAVGPVKQRDRGFGAGQLLTGIAAAQLAGEDFLTGLDRHRADGARPACKKTTRSPEQILPAPAATSAGRPSLPSPCPAGEIRSWTRTATIPAPPGSSKTASAPPARVTSGSTAG
ncbi:MAG: hypothetical protein ACLPUO_06860 [Streptosporangiaceae bacterium]